MSPAFVNSASLPFCPSFAASKSATQLSRPWHFSRARARHNTPTLALTKTPTSEAPPALSAPAFIDPQQVIVNPNTGEVAKVGVQLTIARIELPTGTVPGLDLSTERAATALIVVPTRRLRYLKYTSAVIFSHGFSQRPSNTQTMLNVLAAQGRLVIAPRVWLFDLPPWVKVQTTNLFTSLPTKLQTAELIDCMRCIDYVKGLGVPRYSLSGHSMGGAQSLVAAWKLPKDPMLSSVTLFAPAVSATATTNLNPLLNLSSKDDLETFFREFPGVPVQIMHGTRDRIVWNRNIEKLVDAMRASRAVDDITLLTNIINGSHFGFEDSIGVDVPLLYFWDKIIFGILDFILFGPLDFLNLFDSKEQLKLTKEILRPWIQGAEDGLSKSRLKEKIDALGIKSGEITYEW